LPPVVTGGYSYLALSEPFMCGNICSGHYRISGVYKAKPPTVSSGAAMKRMEKIAFG